MNGIFLFKLKKKQRNAVKKIARKVDGLLLPCSLLLLWAKLLYSLLLLLMQLVGITNSFVGVVLR